MAAKRRVIWLSDEEWNDLKARAWQGNLTVSRSIVKTLDDLKEWELDNRVYTRVEVGPPVELTPAAFRNTPPGEVLRHPFAEMADDFITNQQHMRVRVRRIENGQDHGLPAVLLIDANALEFWETAANGSGSSAPTRTQADRDQVGHIIPTADPRPTHRCRS